MVASPSRGRGGYWCRWATATCGPEQNRVGCSPLGTVSVSPLGCTHGCCNQSQPDRATALLGPELVQRLCRSPCKSPTGALQTARGTGRVRLVFERPRLCARSL